MARLPQSPRTFFIGLITCLISLTTITAWHTPVCSQTTAIGDTLTVIQRPLLNIPALVTPGDTLRIDCAADPSTTGWTAQLSHGQLLIPLEIVDAGYDPTTLWWTLSAPVPAVPLFELFDLRVTAEDGLDDTTRHAVQILSEFKSHFYFAHLTDTHLPDHAYHDQGGSVTDSTEIVDLREVIHDINLIHPEFVLLTGDLVNEGELEDYLEWRSYTRAQRLLAEFEVPVFLIAGNHDIGGWEDSPPPDGTARRNWWRFFGWPHLDDPPSGAPQYTQNYSFDYGSVHFTALESYVNYDMWRPWIYGSESFTSGQLAWLADDLAAATGSAKRILFYHYDFSHQLDLPALGVDMALWGHIHNDSGSLTSQPYDLATNNVCDWERSYRMVRVINGNLYPRPTLTTGSAGQFLRLEYAGDNNGEQDLQEATVYNGFTERFEHSLVKFHMPSGGSYQASGGNILQADDSGPVTVVYLEVDILPQATLDLAVWREPTGVAEAPSPLIPFLHQNHPNPFNPTTDLRYSLPRSMHVRLSVYDLQGREVARLVDGPRPAGTYTVRWNGRDWQAREMPSGVYVTRLSAGGRTSSQKIVLAR